MKLYNVEIFTPGLDYRSSGQAETAPYSLDYLDIESNKIELIEIKAEKDDYIRIKSGKTEMCGIITDVSINENTTVITYKGCISRMDIEVYYDRLLLETKTLENWIANIIEATYKTNTDTLQNIVGLKIEVLSATPNALLNLETNIGNLFNIITTSFINYGVVINFKLDPKRKEMICTIKKNISVPITIEAGLPNIFKKEIIIRKSKETLNKLIVINEEDETQQAIFYRTTADIVTSTSENRITPVVFKTVYIKLSGTDIFIDKAYDTAFNTLTAEKYDNLIELTMTNEDDLVKPYNLEIGQEVFVIDKSVIYNTVLTGYEKDAEFTKLIFGAIRLELIKNLKRR